jgi:hypothetical protein
LGVKWHGACWLPHLRRCCRFISGRMSRERSTFIVLLFLLRKWDSSGRAAACEMRIVCMAAQYGPNVLFCMPNKSKWIQFGSGLVGVEARTIGTSVGGETGLVGLSVASPACRRVTLPSAWQWGPASPWRCSWQQGMCCARTPTPTWPGWPWLPCPILWARCSGRLRWPLAFCLPARAGPVKRKESARGLLGAVWMAGTARERPLRRLEKSRGGCEVWNEQFY